VIRGLDGDRVRMLGNGGNSFDASALSYDHAVPIDPLVVERIEVLRGPAALAYGGSAIGGVVNAIDNRIPRAPIRSLGGAAEVRLGGAQHERGGAALVETGDGRWAVHADVFGRDTDDLRVPRFVPLEDDVPLEATRTVRNSASRARGGALGASFTHDSGHLGIAVDRYDSRYGIVVEPDVTIRMQRDHLALDGEWRWADGALRSLRGRLGRTVYEHREIEGSGEVGTLFATRGNEARLEAEHTPLGPLRGVFGAHWESSDFSALGEEAFVPSTTTRKQGLFVLEEMSWPLGTLSGGARIERARVASAGDAEPSAGVFGPAQQRRFSLRSASLSNLWKFSAGWTLATTLAHTERAPTSFELYANGVHAATAAYERGDPSLGVERGRNLDVALRWTQGDSELRLGAFESRFSRYITLAATGASIDVVGEDGNVESLPEYVFRSARARLRGVELQGRQRLALAEWALDLQAQIDLVRGDDLDRAEPLPRLAPARLRLGLDATHGPWRLSASAEHARRQRRVPATDAATPGYTLVDLAAARRFDWGGRDALVFVKLANLGDVLARSASSIATVRELAPLPGRSLKAGVRVDF
jgi:iron complex outermembrane receptor protein